MNINLRVCRKHENAKVTHLCGFKECKQQSRWCCTQCIKERLHQHNELSFIIPWQEMLTQRKQAISKLINNQLQQGQEISQHLLILLKELQNQIEQQLLKTEMDVVKLKDLYKDLTKEQFTQLDDERIDQIINVNLNQFIEAQQQYIEPINIIQQKIKQLEKIVKGYMNDLNNVTHPNDYNLENPNYTFKQIEYYDNYQCRTSQISNNEQYLAFGGDFGLLKIYDIQTENTKSLYPYTLQINVCSFTSDSSQLYAGCEDGKVYGFNVLNDFQIILNLKIHKKGIKNLRTIYNQYLITRCSDNQIRKTDIKRKKLIFQLICQENIYSIDYNQMDDMLISGGQSIIIWKCDSRSMIINRLYMGLINQIQFSNDHSLLILDNQHVLIKNQINFQTKDLIAIKDIRSGDLINFYQINQNFILMILYNNVVVYDKDLELYNYDVMSFDSVRSSIYFNQQNLQKEIDFPQGESKQLQNAKYIHLRQSDRIILGEAQNLYN